MNDYQKLVARLKVAAEDLQVLHRNLVGDVWLPTHEQLGEYYQLLIDTADAVIEMGLSQGIPEVSITEALKEYPQLKIKNRKANESLTLAKDIIVGIANQMQALSSSIEDTWIVSKLDEFEYTLRIIGEYKLARAVM